MKPAVREARSATAAEWDALYEACPHATASQARGWAEDWASYTHGMMRPDPLLLSLDDGSRLIVPLTRQRRRRGLASRYIAAPAGTYGGWLACEPLGESRARAVAEWLLRRRAPLWWRLSPFDPDSAALATLTTEADETHVLHLSEGADAVFACATHGHRCAVHKAQRNGLSVRRADSAADWETYYDIYLESLGRWGEDASSRYGAELFELLRRRGSPAVELWLVTLADGEIVSGGVALYAARHVTYWHASTRTGHFALRPSNLMAYEMANDACRRGLEWFDLNPSGGIEGVKTFKRRLGAAALPAPVVTCERHLPGRWPHRPGRPRESA